MQGGKGQIVKSAAVIIYSENDNSFFFQVRSNNPEIWWPKRLGCFGGACELTEDSLSCMIRELDEELPNSNFALEKLCVIQTYNKIRHYFLAKVKYKVDYQVAEGDGGTWCSLEKILNLPIDTFVPMDLGVVLHFVKRHD